MTAPNIPRSPYVKIGGLFHLGRMLDKARLFAGGLLPPEYESMRGKGFDGRLCRYLGVSYDEIARWAVESDDDEAIIARCFSRYRRLSEEDKLIWNSFVSKRGWRDDESDAFIIETAREIGLDDDGSLQTDFDLIEADEGRLTDAWHPAWDPVVPKLPYPPLVAKQAAIFRQLSQPLEPLATDAAVDLRPLEGIRAVIFDIYGTLIISGSGDISLAAPEDRDAILRASLASVGIHPIPEKVPLTSRFHDAIVRAQEQRKAEGVEYPEVEIREVWTEFLAELAVDGLSFPRLDRNGVETLAIDYEARVNPVWPMPHLAETLATLRASDLLLGIVSNAQFYSRLMFPAFLGQPLAQLGFSLDCTVWSYREREGKPSTALYEKLAVALGRRGIKPTETLYIGNDRRNDIWPATQLGFRTALFAGDARSLRWRHDDPRLQEVQADRVITNLYQLVRIVGQSTARG